MVDWLAGWLGSVLCIHSRVGGIFRRDSLRLIGRQGANASLSGMLRIAPTALRLRVALGETLPETVSIAIPSVPLVIQRCVFCCCFATVPCRQAGKITPTVNLFKGKRSAEETGPEFAEETAAIYGDEESGTEMQEEEDDGDAPEWLADAIKSGAVSFGSDGGPDLDVPRKDIGQDKPFRF